jgi:hypothetical protein
MAETLGEVSMNRGRSAFMTDYLSGLASEFKFGVASEAKVIAVSRRS